MEHLGPFILNHWQLWLALIVVLVVIFLNELSIQRSKNNELTPQAAVDLINHENAIVVDLRDEEVFNKGHIINSIHAKKEDFEQQKMKKYKNKPLILVCTGNAQAQSLASKLRTEGYNPQVLSGGIAAWVSADFPLMKGK